MIFQSAISFVHNLLEIAKRAEILSDMTEDQIDLLDILNAYYIKARYPSDKKKLADTLTASKVNGLIKRSEEFFIWLKQKKN